MLGKNIIFLTIFSLNSALIGMNNFNEKLLAITPCNQQICIADLQSGEKKGYINFSHAITAISLNNSRKKLAILSQSEVSIFEIPKNNQKLTYKKTDSFKHNNTINSIYFDKEDNLLGININDAHQLQITDLKTNKEITSFNHHSWVTVGEVSPSGTFFATSSGNNKMHLFNLEKKEEIVSLDLDNAVNAFAFNPEETLLAIASRDKKIYIFDLEKYNKITSIDHDKEILSICFES